MHMYWDEYIWIWPAHTCRCQNPEGEKPPNVSKDALKPIPRWSICHPWKIWQCVFVQSSLFHHALLRLSTLCIASDIVVKEKNIQSTQKQYRSTRENGSAWITTQRNTDTHPGKELWLMPDDSMFNSAKQTSLPLNSAILHEVHCYYTWSYVPLSKQTLNMKSLLFVEGKDHYTIPEISTPTSII